MMIWYWRWVWRVGGRGLGEGRPLGFLSEACLAAGGQGGKYAINEFFLKPCQNAGLEEPPRLKGGMRMTEKGYYSLVQFCPDDSRLESVNIGLAVFLPDVPRVLTQWTTKAKRRINTLFGPQDWVLVELQKKAIDIRLKNHQDFSTRDSIDRFAETRASAVRLTTARAVKFNGPVEQEFDALFERLVQARRVAS